jgi:hypothetical protein
MGQPSAELLSAVREVATARNWAPQDLLAVIGYETGGTYDPWQRGPTTRWGEHRGLIQWGEDQRRDYGVTRDMSETDQVRAAGRYLSDRGLESGMGLLPMYAAINGGNVGAVNASDENNGGAPGTVTDKVNSPVFQDHMRYSANFLGEDYVPRVQSGVPSPEAPPSRAAEGRGSDEFNAAYELPELPMDGVPPVGEDGVPEDPFASQVTGLITDQLFGSNRSSAPPPPLMQAPPPPPPRPKDYGPVVLVRKKKEKEKR